MSSVLELVIKFSSQHVDEGSSAWDAGLRPGFVITHVNGEVRTI